MEKGKPPNDRIKQDISITIQVAHGVEGFA